MDSYSLADAKARLSELIDRAEAGESVKSAAASKRPEIGAARFRIRRWP